jgi:DNA-binding LacI/PurR family transcriptional regulator
LLTTVSQPFEAMAGHAARILRTRVDDPAAPVQAELLSGNLIERSSAQLLGVRY